MGTIRILVTAGAALCAGLILISAPAGAREDATQTPLKLTPPTKQAKKVARATAAKKPRRTAQRRTRAAPRGQDGGHVMRGQDSISLISLLPWWRADEMQTIRYRQQEVESQVLVAADAWLTSPTAAAVAGEANDAVQLASADDVNEPDRAAGTINITDPNDFNEIDLAAADAPQPADQSWLHGLLAMLGGALAAASTARFLFV